jgi:hypothetical protein
MQADFHIRNTGTRIQNIISQGPGGEHDLYLTFTFAFVFPDVEEGSPEAAEKVTQMKEMSNKVVPGSVVEIRELAQKGEI